MANALTLSICWQSHPRRDHKMLAELRKFDPTAKYAGGIGRGGLRSAFIVTTATTAEVDASLQATFGSDARVSVDLL